MQLITMISVNMNKTCLVFIVRKSQLCDFAVEITQTVITLLKMRHLNFLLLSMPKFSSTFLTEVWPSECSRIQISGNRAPRVKLLSLQNNVQCFVIVVCVSLKRLSKAFPTLSFHRPQIYFSAFRRHIAVTFSATWT